jgi:hypothetical protein
MKASELRIGNWYQWYAEGKYYKYQVEGIDLIQNYENFEPIPITEVWLTDFGFIYPDPHYLIWYKEGFGPFRVLFDIHLKHWQIGYSGGRVFKKIEYVHQLQNLYFYLTDKELKLNEK